MESGLIHDLLPSSSPLPKVISRSPFFYRGERGNLISRPKGGDSPLSGKKERKMESEPRVVLRLTVTELSNIILSLQGHVGAIVASNRKQMNGEAELLNDLKKIKTDLKDRAVVHDTTSVKAMLGPMYCESCD